MQMSVSTSSVLYDEFVHLGGYAVLGSHMIAVSKFGTKHERVLLTDCASVNVDFVGFPAYTLRP